MSLYFKNRAWSSKTLHITVLFFLFLVHFLSLIHVFFPSLNNRWLLGSLEIGLSHVALYLSGLVFSYLFLVFSKGRNVDKKGLRRIVLIGAALSLLVILFSYLLIFVESREYINFLYSNYHVDGLSLPAYINFHYFLLGILILGGVNLKHIVKLPFVIRAAKILKSSTEPSPLLAIFALVLVINVLKGFVGNIEAEIYYYKINNYSFDERGKVVDLPELKKETAFINAYTSRNSLIIHPYQVNSYQLGNQVLLRYFLFPRFLVSSEKLSNYTADGHSLAGAYYILAKSDTEEKFYPEEEFFASKIIILFKNGETKSYYNVQYGQEFAQHLGSFDVGLIQKQE